MEQKMRRTAAALLAAVLLCCVLSVQALAPGQAMAASQVTVRFYSNGSGSEPPAPITVEQGGQMTIPQALLDSPIEVDGWSFVGWAEQSTSPSPEYLPGEALYLTRNMDLYAVFSKDFAPSHTVRPGVQAPDAFTVKTGAHDRYMSGFSDGLFHPSQPLTRGEMAQMLFNIVVERPAAAPSFPDVSSGDWYAPAVSAMAGLGVLEGYSDGTFRPEQPITRAESAQALAQLVPTSGQTRTFRDVPASHPAYAAICAVGSCGLFSGDSSGNFNPDAGFQRAEAAVVFNKLLGRSPDPGAIYSTGLRYFPDVPTTHWAYGPVMEAATSHGHTSSGNGELWQNVQTEAVPLSDGFYRINGGLYCVSGGRFLRSASRDCFTFDNEGRYTTGDAELDINLNALVEQLTIPSMTRDQQLRALYNYCRDNFSYLKRPLLAAGTTGWEPEYASAFLTMRKGNCFSFSALFCLLAREVGQPAYTVIGGLGKNASPHGWVEITLDGTNYMFDPQLEWRYVHDYGRKSHNLFKVLPQNTSHTYTKLSGGTP